MSQNYLVNDDTIVALSTPPGVGAIGVIRLSGKEAIPICQSVFKGKDLAKQDSHTLHFGKIVDGQAVLDEVVVGLFKALHSYTTEDVVEISCHGSPYIQSKVIELLIEKGARLAQPGEFTLRAFLNGRLDLSQAEAVADLISSGTKASHDAAIRQMRGGFSNKIKELRDKLVEFASLVELELDFAEEDVEFADRTELKILVEKIQTLIKALIKSFELGNVIKHGVNVVIAGRPNAGKSTLLNRLLNEERAIVSEIPGTTRDTIEEVLNIDGILFRMIDTAGIRDAHDTIEKMGVEKTLEKIRQSSVLMYLFDVTEMTSDFLKEDLAKLDAEKIPMLLIGNKTDLPSESAYREQFQDFENILWVSSKEGDNVEAIIEALKKMVWDGSLDQDETIVTNARHFEALKNADTALSEVLNGLDQNLSGEMVALDIRSALDSLGEITGEVTTEDLLGSIFSRFCIGK